jgi:hypothetical protein
VTWTCFLPCGLAMTEEKSQANLRWYRVAHERRLCARKISLSAEAGFRGITGRRAYPA